MTQSGLVTPRQVLLATYITFGLAALSVCTWSGRRMADPAHRRAVDPGRRAYTGGPWPYGYHALGDVLCFIFFGVLAVVGSAYLQTLTVTPS